MTALYSILYFGAVAFANPTTDQKSIDSWLYSVDELTPHGRLQAAIQALESNPANSTIVAFGNTHPHIAYMLTDSTSKLALQYMVLLPSPERNRLRKGDGVIRQIDKMGKAEKKQALLLAKTLGLPKKLVAIRINSFNGIDMSMEITYKSQGTTTGQIFTLARPYTPEFAKEARKSIQKSTDTKPLPPLKGAYSLMPFDNPSFELNNQDWTQGVGFEFENPEPVGTLSFDDDVAMDGERSLKFYNTEDTMVFPNYAQSFPVGDTYKIRFQAFVQSKNTKVEYRQDPSATNISLHYKMADGSSLKSETEILRLGTYEWEPIIIESFVPQDAETLEVVIGSSVSGSLWVDGCSMIRIE